MMPKKTETLLALDPPEELIFRGPFDHPIGKNITILNPSKTTSVTFKMKTTSPRLFFVRPNIGVLKPEKSINIEIYLQPIGQADIKQKRHKFMIQAVEVDGNENFDLPEFWKHVKLDTIWDARIRCELVSGKNNDDDEDGGRRDGRLENKVFMHGHEEPEVQYANEPIDVDKLMKKVSVLEEERLFLKQELKSLRQSKANEQQANVGVMLQKSKAGYFYIGATIFTMTAAVVGAYLGKQYM